jgi:hypothetical protein
MYDRRKSTVEQVFGIINAPMGFRRFLHRGHKKVEGEWKLFLRFTTSTDSGNSKDSVLLANLIRPHLPRC